MNERNEGPKPPIPPTAYGENSAPSAPEPAQTAPMNASGYEGEAPVSAAPGYAQGGTQPFDTAEAPYGAHRQSTPYVPAAAGGKTSNSKTFLFAFLGAALACVLALGGFTLFGHVTSTVTVGGSGAEITVQGDDANLSEVVAQKALPSVVNINVYTQSQSQGWPVGQSSTELTESSLGSGIILSSDGYILTNYHVIEGASKLVVNAGGEEYDATVVGTDESSDLAVLKVNATNLTAIEIGSSSDLTVGEWVMAVGSPFGLEQSVSTGIVSAVSRSSSSLNSSTTSVYVNMIQTDAAINPGNSGGALVDKDGKLIGVNTLIASSSGSSSGVGFAIPVDYAMQIAQQIIDGKTPSHAQVGVSTVSVTSQLAQRYALPVSEGAYVSAVTSGGGAEKAGIQAGDIITKVGDTEITSATDLVIAARSHSVGDVVSVTFNRNGQEQTVDVTLGSDV